MGSAKESRKIASTDQQRKLMYAVAIRDGSELFLILSICRAAQGDVYVNFPRDYRPGWKPHSSYHASGQHHQKSFGHKSMVNLRQPPVANFSGTENIVTTPIASDEPRAINVPCNTADFHEVFEIPLNDIRPEKYRTSISVDIMEANGTPIIYPGAKIVQQHTFQDTVPWIMVTLFESA